ncbi:hypothetical protein [Singulisphaera sp. GP187]|uniref:hypothetical protein n=1 Tax=Singulisphaera sp. GP187 TaxID=1882752 RepID=UPI000940E8F7|nr:hypothetical protein [Singulisphaera sp. GP187]
MLKPTSTCVSPHGREGRPAVPCETPTDSFIIRKVARTGLQASERSALASKEILWRQRQLWGQG